jgi:hypothetical protein
MIGHIVNNTKYEKYLFTCPLQFSLPIPTHVSFTMSMCGSSTIYLSIQVPVKSHWQHEFGVCVATGYSNITIEAITEWIELTANFGVTEFNIYNESLSSELRPIFYYYKREAYCMCFQCHLPTRMITKAEG